MNIYVRSTSCSSKGDLTDPEISRHGGSVCGCGGEGVTWWYWWLAHTYSQVTKTPPILDNYSKSPSSNKSYEFTWVTFVITMTCMVRVNWMSLITGHTNSQFILSLVSTFCAWRGLLAIVSKRAIPDADNLSATFKTFMPTILGVGDPDYTPRYGSYGTTTLLNFGPF